MADSDNNLSQIAYHEAGHAVVSEILCPGSVTLVAAYSCNRDRRGFTGYFRDNGYASLYLEIACVIVALGGMAAVEQKFGIFDAGCEEDLDKAFYRMRDLVVNNCVCGFKLHSKGFNDSSRLEAEQEQAVVCEIEKYYRKAKQILAKNVDFLDRVAAELAEKRLLSSEDIRRIKKDCALKTEIRKNFSLIY